MSFSPRLLSPCSAAETENLLLIKLLGSSKSIYKKPKSMPIRKLKAGAFSKYKYKRLRLLCPRLCKRNPQKTSIMPARTVIKIKPKTLLLSPKIRFPSVQFFPPSIGLQRLFKNGIFKSSILKTPDRITGNMVMYKDMIHCNIIYPPLRKGFVLSVLSFFPGMLSLHLNTPKYTRTSPNIPKELFC